ncbi:MAG: signal peptidase II [Deltaproteobacteria bacterium HGW-Deltaproteobacteria-12]|jgi:signal peptidase II|nr:MAG: signal peptidase II [Deltaproteobacteria bacterium HGW-Deltaproteobacteria-12]
MRGEAIRDRKGVLVKRNIIFFVLGAAAVIVLDQITKNAILSRFAMHESHEVIHGFFNLVYVTNPGAAFGFLASASEAFRYFFFIGVTVVAISLIIYYLVKSKPGNIVSVISLTLIFAGAVGNLIDRIRFGAVVDFLDFYLGTWHWPAFNVADSAISVGAVLMIWEMIINTKKRNISRSKY